MIWVEPGTFTMGQEGLASTPKANPTHQVTITQGFYLGKYEVTQAQYEAVMSDNKEGLSATPSYFSGNPNRPVEAISHNHIKVFLDHLNSKMAESMEDGWEYALPTEAQWEYACRADTTTPFFWGSSYSSINANFLNYIGETTDVGQYSANPWGFFDMHGNVWEWTADWSGPYSSNAKIDPTGPSSGTARINRGGSYHNSASDITSAKRHDNLPTGRGNNIGFRLAFMPVKKTSIDPASGLVAHYPFDGNASDMSGNGNHGILSGTPNWEYNDGRYCINFSELGQLMTAPIADYSNNFSYTFWAKPTSSHDNQTADTSGIEGISGQSYIIFPRHGGDYGSGVGCSLGTNGVSIYEH